MNIILVSDGLAKSRTWTVSPAQLGFGFFAVLGLVFGLGAWSHSRIAKTSEGVHGAAPAAVPLTLDRKITLESLNRLAAKVGELQGRMQRLDAFSDRLAKSVGVKPQELKSLDVAAKGGPLETRPVTSQTVLALAQQMDELVKQTDDRGERLEVLDQLLRDERVATGVIPTTLPVTTGYHSSNFGYRSDPFTSGLAFHAGIDFIAGTGSPIYAAAGGVVVTSDMHGEYGNMIEIDHGNGLTTRYAHTRKRYVKAGEIVLKGQKIAEVGSTGRSTGAHLHFEVRDRGTAINPVHFLKISG
jgi:murein DD-endopeptidase MepM/ murein hydrolase activator NlpD